MKRVLMAFLLGACSGTVASSVAEDAPEVPEQVAVAAPVAADTPSPTVRTLEEAEHRQAPPGTADIWLLAQGEEAFVGLLTMVPGASVPEHQDATEEYIHVLEGGGVLTIDGAEYTLSAGSTVFMPADATVSYANSDAPMKALQVFAGPGPAEKYDAWSVVK